MAQMWHRYVDVQHQRREREVDEHVAAGRVDLHETTEDFLAHHDALDNDQAKAR